MGYRFIDNNGTFELEGANFTKDLYLPLCNEAGMMSCVTPTFGGDAKLDRNTFILPPVSTWDLHTSRATRNFWLCFPDGTMRSATGESVWQKASYDAVKLRAGMLWQQTETEITAGSGEQRLKCTVTAFVPADATTAEAMRISIENMSDGEAVFTPTAVIPLYCRSADNIRDHRHVTSLLNRIFADENGVRVIPTLSFDERGHIKNRTEYFVAGCSDSGRPVRIFPTAEDVLGESGEWDRPDGIRAAEAGPAAFGAVKTADCGGYDIASCRDRVFEGHEAAGGLMFEECRLKKGERAEYFIFIGAHDRDEEYSSPAKVLERFGTGRLYEAGLEAVKKYWAERIVLKTETGVSDFDSCMRWVALQPYIRRIMGCSFLPYHDYGKGGRGWRDLWQDCLALLLMEPQRVRGDLLNNFAGIRTDGTNATIIGTKPGEFIADRNNIVRVWMDHGLWPWKTVKLYLDRTGDYDFLKEEQTYFKDAQRLRSRKDWIARAEEEARNTPCAGTEEKTSGNAPEPASLTVKGTVFEHLLLMHLCVAGDLGEHGYMRLRGADWNDALDMAPDRGESVAFTAAYAGNLAELAAACRKLGSTVGLHGSIAGLLRAMGDAGDDTDARSEAVRSYCMRPVGTAQDGIEEVPAEETARILEALSGDIMRRIRENERMESGDFVWYNGYYDNCGRRVESLEDKRVMLTGAVFAIMSGTAPDSDLDAMIRTADSFLLREGSGGYALNTRFENGEYYASNLGRAFGFSYGDKENGAVFCHMAVMYAYALKQRGRREAADRVIRELYEASADFDTSAMYPGIPEYFNLRGRGMYTYLTGAASWLLLYFFE